MIYYSLLEATIVYEKRKQFEDKINYSSAVDVKLSSTEILGSGGCSGGF